MEFFVVERQEKTKTIKIVNNDTSVLILTRYVADKPEVQAMKLKHNGVEYDRWRPHGSFLKLVNKCLDSNFRDKNGDRKEFLENLYNERFNLIKQIY